WVKEIASFALRLACSKPSTWLVSRCVITRPAASSAARLMRKPDASLSVVVPSPALAFSSIRCDDNDEPLVFTTIAISLSSCLFSCQRQKYRRLYSVNNYISPRAGQLLLASPGDTLLIALLLQQTQRRLWPLVRLRQHCSTGLLQDLCPGQLCRFFGKVSVAATAACASNILS